MNLYKITTIYPPILNGNFNKLFFVCFKVKLGIKMVRAILGSRHTFPACLPERPEPRPSVLWCGRPGGVWYGVVWCVVCGVMHTSFVN